MKLFIIITNILFIVNVHWSQNGEKNRVKIDMESIIYLKDSTLIKEVAQFSIKGAAFIKKNNYIKPKLTDIHMVNCTDSSAYFAKGNLYSSELIINMNSQNTISKLKKLKEIRFIHYKYAVTVPNSAINDINEPIFCNKNTDSLSLNLTKPKVFQSIDKKRIYIYMVIGHGLEKYEVTWIVINDKYYARIIDLIKYM